ncbi:MAG TPA: MFS transporter [candidate division WOR-3 bacterium]|uniref:MFS transporter n=1 Tax=candidate division WOR-3 bacterium TaxID=2052148 RepID=A0A7V0T5V3_UNCW3|nr:MFS transporter [candidate division WOR-3 bacterium]
MSEGKLFNRWLIVVGAIMIQLSLGAIYAWSVFRVPLQDAINITPTQASLPFSFVLIFFALATVAGGRMQDKLGPKAVAIFGGMLLAAGMILASFARDITMLIVAYGIISGIGIGFAYVCPIAAGVKWFPDKRGLITGLSVAGFGAGALIVAPLARAMIDSPAVGIFATFRWLGIAYLVLIVVGGLILRNPPAGYCPVGWSPPKPAPGKVVRTDYTLAQMLATGQFWIIWLLYFAGCAAGLMMIGQTSPIGQELAGLNPTTAALGVSVLAISNGLGRVFWGRISDSIGRTRTLTIMYLINGIAVFGYFLIPAAPFVYWIGIALVGATFGGYLALYPAVTADFYGTTHVGLNYGFVFTAYGFGGLLSNIFAPRVLELTGNYNFAFILTGALCIVAGVLIGFVKPPAPKVRPTCVERSPAS